MTDDLDKTAKDIALALDDLAATLGRVALLLEKCIGKDDDHGPRKHFIRTLDLGRREL
jgi:hypothetical protein